MGPNVCCLLSFILDLIADSYLHDFQFDNLDESVQSEFEAYLEERGVDSALALFIPDLAEHKEQKCVPLTAFVLCIQH